MIDRLKIIKKMRANKKTYRQIAVKLGVSTQRIHQIYKHYTSIDNSLRKKVRKRDQEKCAICDSIKNLEVHHIDGSRSDQIANLVTLCKKCHARVESSDRKTIKNTEEKYRSFEDFPKGTRLLKTRYKMKIQ